MRGLIAHFGDDQGSSLVVVAMATAALLGAAVLSVDAGSLWVARRTLVTATDSAALGAASVFARGSDGCGEPRIATLFGANASASTFSCDVVNDGGSGSVQIDGRSASVTLAFVRALGIGNPTITASSAAMWGPVTRVRGARPLAVCANDDAIRNWMDDVAYAEPGPSAVTRMPIGSKKDDCRKSNTGWSLLDLNSDGSSRSQIDDWLRNGYDGPVGIDDCDGNASPGDPCGEDKTRPHDVNGALHSLLSAGKPFAAVIVEPNGKDLYRVVGFVGVLLDGIHTDEGNSDQYLDVQFSRLTVDGDCCATAGGLNAGVVGARLCGQDHDPVGREVRCALWS